MHYVLPAKVRTAKICWYLDATFCYHFRSLDEGGTDVVRVLRPPSHRAPLSALRPSPHCTLLSARCPPSQHATPG